jgi:hypothetical protein
VEEVVTKVMQADKVAELYQIKVIVSLHMGNLNLEVSGLKNKLTTEEKEKPLL